MRSRFASSEASAASTSRRTPSISLMGYWITKSWPQSSRTASRGAANPAIRAYSSSCSSEWKWPRLAIGSGDAGRSAALRRGRPDRAAAAFRIEHAPHLAQHEHRIGEEHERLDRAERGEVAGLERQRVGVAERRVRLCELDHVAAVVDACDLAADRLAHVADERAAAAADVEQAVVLRQLQRLEQLRPEEVVRGRRAVVLARLTAVRPPRELVRLALEPPAG